MVITDNIKDLMNLARLSIGGGVQPVQLKDDAMCALLKIAIGDFAEKVQNWVIKTQWVNLQGKKGLLKNHKKLMIKLY